MATSSDPVTSFKNEAIVATGLTKWFGEGEARVTAVNQVGLVAHFGEMLFIVGPSGSGKTTMLSMISGILRLENRRATGQRDSRQLVGSLSRAGIKCF
jgi:ABC-type lipoprotein export system ATPase subunit